MPVVAVIVTTVKITLMGILIRPVKKETGSAMTPVSGTYSIM